MSFHNTVRPDPPVFNLPNTKEWKDSLAPNYGIQYIETVDQIPDQLKGEKVLWTSRCSRTKTGKDSALPKEFYVSKLNLKFYEYMERYGLRYGILSDLYGIHMDDEYLDFYDIHPSQLTAEQKQKLGSIIGEKVRQYGYEEVVFYNSSPLQSRPYFEMLWWSELKVYFISTIGLLDQKYGNNVVTAHPAGKAKQMPLFNLLGGK